MDEAMAAGDGYGPAVRWVFYRIDDNDNILVVRDCVGSEEANRLVAEFTAPGHKQTYWAEPYRR